MAIDNAALRYLIDTYLDWSKQQGIPVIEGVAIDLNTIETAPWQRLGGGCKVPVGAHARQDGSLLRVRGVLAALDGSRVVCEELDGSAADAESLGALVGERLALRGAEAFAELRSG